MTSAVIVGAASVLTKTGEQFLPAVAQEIATALKAELVLVGEYIGSDRVRSVVLWRSGHGVDNIEYSLRGTPSEQLSGQTIVCYPRDVQAHFPADAWLTGVNADGFVGMPLVSDKGEAMGVMVAITTEPIEDTLFARSVLELFAGRVAAEMQRTRSERELRRSEEHLRQVQRVEAIGRLAGNVAHDFNNLLLIVIGYGEILRERVGPSKELTALLAAASRATNLTRQLLAFGRRQVLQVQRVDLNKVVTQVQAMLSGAVGSGVRLTTSLDAALPNVEVDPGQFEQVLVNLAINARDAMPEGGTLHIETGVEGVPHAYNQMPPGRYVRLSVTDTGTGMPPEVLAQIFEPFYTTKGSGGTGLGLSSVYGIVKQSGGYIWCFSEPGKGTTFKIYLRPLAGRR